jgi:hypothetical protein
MIENFQSPTVNVQRVFIVLVCVYSSFASSYYNNFDYTRTHNLVCF